MLDVSQIDTSKEAKYRLAKYLSEHPEDIQQYLDVISLKQHESYYKAAYILEAVVRYDAQVFESYLSQILELAKTEKKHQVVRPLAKIIEGLVLANYVDKAIKLSRQELETISELCFDWLIGKQRVAVKAYTMTSLHHLGNTFDWIHPQLILYLEDNFTGGSAGFKVRARRILNDLK